MGGSDGIAVLVGFGGSGINGTKKSHFIAKTIGENSTGEAWKSPSQDINMGSLPAGPPQSQAVSAHFLLEFMTTQQG